MCFFRDEKYQLKINLYNITFYPEYNITLEKTTNKTEDDHGDDHGEKSTSVNHDFGPAPSIGSIETLNISTAFN